MGSPSRMCNTGMTVKDLGKIWLLLFNELLQLGNLPNLLIGKDFILLVTINGKTCGVIATVLQTREACGEITAYQTPGWP